MYRLQFPLAMNWVLRPVLPAIVALMAVFLTFSCPLEASLITIPLASLEGTIDPFTYTDSTGTFTTSPVALSLSDVAPSFFTFDTDTMIFSTHVFTAISFNDGKPGGGDDLSGVFFMQSSTVSPGFDVPVEDVLNGVLTGAGPFDGTQLSGKHTFTWRLLSHEWNFRGGFLDLPADFVGGPIPITGLATAQFVPEPSSFTLLMIGVLICSGAACATGALKRRTPPAR